MNQLIKVGVALSALAIFSVSALAGSVTGTWHGRIKIDASKITQPPAEQKAKMMDAINKAQQMVITLTLKADHTFAAITPGRPDQTGSWTESGSTVTLQGKQNGKIMGPAQVFTLSKNQKSMSLTQKDPRTQKDAVLITFSR